MALTVLEVDGRRLETSSDGFLLDAAAWDEAAARALAAGVPLILTEAHWEIVRFIRGYHEKYRHLPNNRMFVKAVQKELGEAQGNSRTLNALFAGSPVKYACLVAGLPKPPGCI